MACRPDQALRQAVLTYIVDGVVDFKVSADLADVPMHDPEILLDGMVADLV